MLIFFYLSIDSDNPDKTHRHIGLFTTSLDPIFEIRPWCVLLYVYDKVSQNDRIIKAKNWYGSLVDLHKKWYGLAFRLHCY